jgi:hypothetical protein
LLVAEGGEQRAESEERRERAESLELSALSRGTGEERTNKKESIFVEINIKRQFTQAHCPRLVFSPTCSMLQPMRN